MTTTDLRQGLNASAAIKVPCRAATTANITLSGEQTIDGVACVTGDRVLVKNQTMGAENGIYIVDTGTWDRDEDWDGVYDVVTGTIVVVTSGTQNAQKFWRISTAGNITIGSTSVLIERAFDSDVLTFTQNGTGAVERSVNDKLNEFVSVKDFGAVGDGVTDDTAAIQAALTAGAGGLVTADLGNYKISGTVSVPPGTTFSGIGACDVLIPLATGTNISIVHTSGPAIKLGRGATLSGINFWYPDQVTTTSPIVYGYTIASDISDVSFQGGNNGGINIRDIVIHNAYNGILFDGDYIDGSPNTGAIIVNNVRIFAISIGMEMVTTASEVNISNCVWSPLFWNASVGQPIRAWTVTNGIGCWVQRSAQGAQFSNCTFFGQKRGIYLYNPSVPSLSRAQCNFLKVIGCLFDGLHRGIEVTDLFGLGGATFTGCQLLARNSFDSSVNDAICFFSNNSSNINYVNFSGCSFLGTAGHHVYINNDPLTANFSFYQFSGCTFYSANANAQAGNFYNVYASDAKGTLIINGSLFSNVTTSVVKIKAPVLEGIKVNSVDIFDSAGTPFDITTVSSRINISDITVRNFVSGTWPSGVSTINVVASDATISLGESDAKIITITGSVNIGTITSSYPGRIVFLKFNGAPTVTDGSNLKLAGDFIAAANSTLSLICDGTNWYELSRSSN